MSKDSIYATPAVPLVAPSAAPTPTVLVPAAESVVKQEAAAAPSPSSTSAEAPSVVVSQPSAQHIKHEDPTATLAAFGLGPEFAGTSCSCSRFRYSSSSRFLVFGRLFPFAL
jgi:hypothetical protein